MLTAISKALSSRAADSAIRASTARPPGVTLSCPPSPPEPSPPEFTPPARFPAPPRSSADTTPETSSPISPNPALVRAAALVASSLPTTTSARRTGDTSSTSSVPRSFSPAVLSMAVAMLPARINCSRNMGTRKASCPLAASCGLLASMVCTRTGVRKLAGTPRAFSPSATSAEL